MNLRDDSNCDICGADMLPRKGLPEGTTHYSDILITLPDGTWKQFHYGCVAELPVRIKALEERVSELQRGTR